MFLKTFKNSFCLRQAKLFVEQCFAWQANFNVWQTDKQCLIGWPGRLVLTWSRSPSEESNSIQIQFRNTEAKSWKCKMVSKKKSNLPGFGSKKQPRISKIIRELDIPWKSALLYFGLPFLISLLFGLFISWPEPDFSSSLLDWRDSGYLYKHGAHELFYHKKLHATPFVDKKYSVPFFCDFIKIVVWNVPFIILVFFCRCLPDESKQQRPYIAYSTWLSIK